MSIIIGQLLTWDRIYSPAVPETVDGHIIFLCLLSYAWKGEGPKTWQLTDWLTSGKTRGEENYGSYCNKINQHEDAPNDFSNDVMS